MGTPLSEPTKTTLIAVQDEHDDHAIHIYNLNYAWITTLDDVSFMFLFGEWAHASIFHPEAGSSKVKMHLNIDSQQM